MFPTQTRSQKRAGWKRSVSAVGRGGFVRPPWTGLTLSGRPGCPGLSPEIPPAPTDSVSTCRTEEREVRRLRTQSAQLKSDFKKNLKSVGFISPLRDLKKKIF